MFANLPQVYAMLCETLNHSITKKPLLVPCLFLKPPSLLVDPDPSPSRCFAFSNPERAMDF